MLVRPAAVAGSFYPAEPLKLDCLVSGLLRDKAQQSKSRLFIVPHAGLIYSGSVAASVYSQFNPGQFSRVVIIGPAHRVAFRGIALAAADVFTTPFGRIPIATDLCEQIKLLSGVLVNDECHQTEHCIEVQLPFLQKTLGSFELVPLLVGLADAEHIAAVLRLVWREQNTLILISSDLSHFLTYEQASEKDTLSAKAIVHLDGAALDSDGACGYLPIRGLLRFAKESGLAGHELARCNSGDTAGNKDRVVGYGAFSFN